MGQAAAWTPILDAGETERAVRVARDVLARLRDPARVERAAAAALEQTGFPTTVRWQPHSVAQGYAGLALLFGTADRCLPAEGWDAVAHEHQQRALRSAEQTPLSAGMVSGIGGLAFAAWLLSRHGARYRRLRRTLDHALLARVASDLVRLTPVAHGMSVSTFDMISGLAGVGRFLLLGEEREHRVALDGVLRWLVALTGKREDVPHWHTPARFLGDEATRHRQPHGALNCGLAHGIPGPLAVLSLAASAGICVEGQHSAIRRIADWLCDHRIQDPRGPYWPTAVPLRPIGGADVSGPPGKSTADLRPSRTAWCYGNPGVARSLWLAGEAVDEPRYRDLAVTGMEAVYRMAPSDRQIDAPTFCHGVAGLQQITLRFARDTGRPLFVEAARTLHRQLLDAYEPASELGYCNIEPGPRRIDQPGLLDGAPAVAMVLLAASTPAEPVWDRLFLLS